jgi:lipopolysaccharide export system protein LptA
MKKSDDCRVNQDRTRGSFHFRNRLMVVICPDCGMLLALQGAVAAVRSACAMRTLVLLIATLLASAGLIQGEIKTPENAPIEITSTGETTYENGVATARDNVVIHIGNTDIYADYAQYNPATHDVELRGHVRIYRDVSLYIAESGIYNTETKKLRATTGRTESEPYFLTGRHVTSISDNGYFFTERHLYDSRFTEGRLPSPRPNDSALRRRQGDFSERDRIRGERACFLVALSLPITQ